MATASSGVPVKLEWEPFLLNPNMDDEGEPILEHLAKKYGAAATKRFGDPNSSLMQSGRKVGIEFTNDRNIYPTLKAHALMEYLKEQDNEKANAFMEDLYKRYFEKGDNINSMEVLAEMVSKYGVDADKAQEIMQDHNRRADILEKDRYNKGYLRVSGVPFFMIEPNKGGQPVAFSGAQPPELIAEVLEEAAEE